MALGPAQAQGFAPGLAQAQVPFPDVMGAPFFFCPFHMMLVPHYLTSGGVRSWGARSARERQRLELKV